MEGYGKKFRNPFKNRSKNSETIEGTHKNFSNQDDDGKKTNIAIGVFILLCLIVLITCQILIYRMLVNKKVDSNKITGFMIANPFLWMIICALMTSIMHVTNSTIAIAFCYTIVISILITTIVLYNVL